MGQQLSGGRGPSAPCRRGLCCAQRAHERGSAVGKRGRLEEGGSGPHDRSGSLVVSEYAGNSREQATGRGWTRGGCFVKFAALGTRTAPSTAHCALAALGGGRKGRWRRLVTSKVRLPSQLEQTFNLAWRSYHRSHVVPPGGHCPSRRCQWPSGMARGWQKIRVTAAPPVSCLETHV